MKIIINFVVVLWGVYTLILNYYEPMPQWVAYIFILFAIGTLLIMVNKEC